MAKTFIDLPNMEHNFCFGCGPANEIGLKMKFRGNDDLVYSEVVISEQFIGWNGVVHGGILSTLCDEIMAWGAIFLTRRLILTKTMSVNYHRPVMAGDSLRVESDVEQRTSERECIMKGRIFNSKGELCVTSSGIFALFTSENLRKMGVVNDRDINEFQMIIDSHA